MRNSSSPRTFALDESSRLTEACRDRVAPEVAECSAVAHRTQGGSQRRCQSAATGRISLMLLAAPAMAPSQTHPCPTPRSATHGRGWPQQSERPARRCVRERRSTRALQLRQRSGGQSAFWNGGSQIATSCEASIRARGSHEHHNNAPQVALQEQEPWRQTKLQNRAENAFCCWHGEAMELERGQMAKITDTDRASLRLMREGAIAQGMKLADGLFPQRSTP